jgi:hypothetical protein
MLKESYIRNFRDEVNKRDFIYFRYKDVGGKSHWNAICSCMDWITVAVRAINSIGEIPKDIDGKVTALFTLISYVDVINESITTLHTVLKSQTKRVSPFCGDKEVFQGMEGKDDNTYFTELRARFGAHPVNLNDKHSKERHFASWPYDSMYGDCDLEVTLYSNRVGGQDKHIKLNKSDLVNFVEIRYGYLITLIEVIRQQYSEFILECKTNVIETKENIKEQIDVLLYENKKRLDSPYFEDNLTTIKDIFSVSLESESLRNKEKAFKNDLEHLVHEIYEHLQNGKFDEDLSQHSTLSVDNLYSHDSYIMGKLMSCLLSKRYDDPMLDYYFKRLDEMDEWGYTFSIKDDFSLTLLKVYLLDREYS